MELEQPRSRDRQGVGFWRAPCAASIKRTLIGGLVLCFLTQSLLVYLDPSDARPLTVGARRGRAIWHRRNCQSCHQLYGFGGFLGPDLTNAAPRLAPERLETVLVWGSGSMPALHLSLDEIDALTEFLYAMDETGRGQARRPQDAAALTDPRWRFVSVVTERLAASPDAAAAAGFQLFQARGCQACHLPLTTSLSGVPDLSTAFERLGRTDVLAVLARGREPRMPRPQLDSAERDAVADFLAWLARERRGLRDQMRRGMGETGLVWSEIPWWEYP